MDLNNAFKIAKSQAFRTERGKEDLVLSKILIEQNPPPKIILSSNESSEGHWKVCFYFAPPAQLKNYNCIVELFLDGEVRAVFRDRRERLAE
jgi:hypothetical protein